MKNRSHAFECQIAGRTVGISLRHGGGLQEPDRVYVRCDERDCQYVDLNEPPCPLRVDMFADGTDRRVAQHLTSHAGQHICYACLTDSLEITHDQVRRATWRLREDIGVVIRPSRCASCRRRRVTIGLREGATVPSVDTFARAPAPAPAAWPGIDALVGRLMSRTGFFFCAHCLARELDRSPADTREAMLMLEQDTRFQIRTGQCVSCLLTKRVIRHELVSDELTGAQRLLQFIVAAETGAHCASCLAFATDLPLADVRRALVMLEGLPELDPREATCQVCGRYQQVFGRAGTPTLEPDRAEGLSAVVGGHVRHRGHRVDLLSFRAADGWRPLAIIKTAVGAIVPDAPAILLGVMPTKLEADELAAAHARAWIDKRIP
jgi:hypothetical protein